MNYVESVHFYKTVLPFEREAGPDAINWARILNGRLYFFDVL